MNNKAFTVVELLASFTLTMIIVVFLFEIVLELKDVYVNDAYKTKVLSQNAIIATTLNKSLKDNKITMTNMIGDNDYAITYENGNSDEIKIEDNKITIGNQIFTMPENTNITNPVITNYYSIIPISDQNEDNAYIKISYTVTSNYLDKDIPFNYVYSYHQNS